MYLFLKLPSAPIYPSIDLYSLRVFLYSSYHFTHFTAEILEHMNYDLAAATVQIYLKT